jgi:hypothetical protein
MVVVRVFVRHPDGSIDDAADLDAARTAARDGDVIGQIHRGGHVEYEALVGTDFIAQPSGWRPALPVYRP